MHRLTTMLASLLTLALPAGLSAQKPSPVHFQTYSLDNGLKVILAEDHSAQVVAVDLWYNVGSRNEQPGHTGFAHLFEHMMFQGSAHVKKTEHIQLVERAGGSLNGSTHDDFTNYFETLPSNRLNLALWLEADRMRSLAITDSTFHNQREAVKEERRLRIENQPYAGAISEELPKIFDSVTCFAYAHPAIGSMKDLDAATTADVQAFFNLYYAPNNATLTIVGDFEPAAAKKIITQYFGAIKRGKEPPPVNCSAKLDAGARTAHLTDAKATLPAALRAYRTPAFDSPDTPPLTLLAAILGQGESSRLNIRLAREARAAIAAQAIHNPNGPRRGPGVFLALAIANQGVTLDSLDGLLAQEIAKIGSEGVTEEELTKAKNSYRASVIEGRQHALNVAEALQTASLFLGSPGAVNSALDPYMAVTVDDIKRVAQNYLRPENSLVLLVSPEAAP